MTKPINFQQLDDSEVLEFFNRYFGGGFLHLNLRRLESVCNRTGNPNSEKAVSQMFDNYVQESQIETSDIPLLRQEYHVFKDNLHREGSIHELQAQNYVYCGELFSPE